MYFEEARKNQRELNDLRAMGTITPEEYDKRVSELRFQDRAGRWWQPNPAGDGWILWDGVRWQSAVPPSEPAPRTPLPPSSQAQQPASPQPATSGRMDVKTFLAISRTVPKEQRPKRWWEIFSVLGGVGVALVWFLYSGLPSSSEGWDVLTLLFMVGLPVAFILFRQPLDDLLMPLQPARQRLPRHLLFGIGLGIPFLTAFLLYNVFSVSNYPLIQANVLVGTCASYATIREPVLAKGYTPAGQSLVVLPFALMLLVALCVRLAGADHCLVDPLNAQDCLRSGGFAPGAAGGAAAAESVFVNAGSRGSDSGGGPSMDDLEIGGGGPDDNPDTYYDGGGGAGRCR